MLKALKRLFETTVEEVKDLVIIRKKVRYRFRQSLRHYNRRRQYGPANRAHRHGWVGYFAIAARIKKATQRRAIKRMNLRTLKLTNRAVA